MVFQRLCHTNGRLRLVIASIEHEVPLLAEDPERVTLGVSEVDQNQWGIKLQSHALLRIEDRGRKFEAITELERPDRLNGVECCHFAMPRLLTCLDKWSLADYGPDRPMPCTYTTYALNIRDGQIRALGQDGMQVLLRSSDGHQVEALRVNGQTTVECALERDIKVILPCVVDHVGDDYMGLRILETVDSEMLKTYRAWLSDRIWSQHERDKRNFAPEGIRSKRKDEPPVVRPGSQARLILDHAPMLLVISEGEAFPNRIAESLGRKFGLATLDYLQGLVKPTLAALGPGDWGPVKLILVHQRLRVSSGLELTHQLVASEVCPLPILVAGTEEDVTLKRNRAIAAGAVDFISVDPFHVLRVMKAIDDTLRMFA